jgi:hypothetical protein
MMVFGGKTEEGTVSILGKPRKMQREQLKASMILNFIGISWTRSDTIDWSVYHPLLIPMNRVYISVGLA